MVEVSTAAQESLEYSTFPQVFSPVFLGLGVEHHHPWDGEVWWTLRGFKLKREDLWTIWGRNLPPVFGRDPSTASGAAKSPDPHPLPWKKETKAGSQQHKERNTKHRAGISCKMLNFGMLLSQPFPKHPVSNGWGNSFPIFAQHTPSCWQANTILSENVLFCPRFFALPLPFHILPLLVLGWWAALEALSPSPARGRILQEHFSSSKMGWRGGWRAAPRKYLLFYTSSLVLAPHKHEVPEYNSIFSKEQNTIISRQKQPIIFFNGQSPPITIQQNKSGFANKQNILWL